MVFKLGIVVGHTANKGGAKGIGIAQEYTYHKLVAEDMQHYAQQTHATSLEPFEVKIFFRDHIGVRGAYKNADTWMGTDANKGLTVELHYNSFDTVTRGTETLSSESPGSDRFAKLVQAKLCTLLGRNGNSRGVKYRNRSKQGRGWLSLVSGIAPAIITEPAFGSNLQDANLMKTKKFEIGRGIIDSAHHYFYVN